MTLPLPGQPGHGRTAVLRRRPVRLVDGRPEGGYTSTYELICPSCGDNPYLDFLDVPSRLQWLRGPWTLEAGLAAYDEHLGPDPSPNGHKAGSLAPVSQGRRHARIGSRNRQQPAAAVGERTKNAIRLVALASAIRLAKDIRTHRAVIMVAIGLVAAAHLARERRNPLEWYFAREPDKPE